nr:hypothetical protein [Tanacetum cinerariifolium]
MQTWPSRKELIGKDEDEDEDEKNHEINYERSQLQSVFDETSDGPDGRKIKWMRIKCKFYIRVLRCSLPFDYFRSGDDAILDKRVTTEEPRNTEKTAKGVWE